MVMNSSSVRSFAYTGGASIKRLLTPPSSDETLSEHLHSRSGKPYPTASLGAQDSVTGNKYPFEYQSPYSPVVRASEPPRTLPRMVAHRRGPWSQHEDAWLVTLVTRNGPHNWVRISQEIGSRSPKQCRERYHQNLKPSLNHDPITNEEGEMIEKMVAEMGKRWAEIARRLKGRSDNAVKNWWNGGQNRRKRNPDRPERAHEQACYHFPSVSRTTHYHEDEPSHHIPHYLHSYHQGRRTSSNLPPSSSHHALKLPQPQGIEPYPGSRPYPLELCSHGARGPGFETPIPSPSVHSVVSTDGAPSLITDTGSESRSPRGAASPLDITLAPLVGGRDERKNSCTRYLPQSGFAVEDDDHSARPDLYRRRGSTQLPPIGRMETSPTFREPDYRAERPQLLTQPAGQFVHHHSLPLSAPGGLASQRPLPPFQPRLPLPSPSLPSSASRQLPLPQLCESRSAPVSPKNKMSLSNIM